MSEASIIFRTFEFEDQGQAWTLDRPNLATEAAFATYLERQAVAGINRHASALGDYGYKAAIGEWQRDVAKGVYGWGKQAFMDALDAPEHAQQFLHVWLNQPAKAGRPANPTIERDQMADVWERQQPALVQLLRDMLSDPNH